MNAPTSFGTSTIIAESPVVRISRAAPCARLSLRARGDLAPLGSALGLALPTKVGQRAAVGDLEACCLGPDEWMLHAPEGSAEEIRSACAHVYEAHPHSLVDVSGREVTLVIDGPRAADLLTLGMARDPDSIAVGEGRRTLVDGVTVILWRDAVDLFYLDVWNSFAPHLMQLFETGCRELAAETLESKGHTRLDEDRQTVISEAVIASPHAEELRGWKSRLARAGIGWA